MKKTLSLLIALACCAGVMAQQPVTFTAEQDHQNMLDQLGIRTIRRLRRQGPCGRRSVIFRNKLSL